MPAMSPTMTEGGLSSWKKQEGDTFAPGDVLLEIVRSNASVTRADDYAGDGQGTLLWLDLID